MGCTMVLCNPSGRQKAGEGAEKSLGPKPRRKRGLRKSGKHLDRGLQRRSGAETATSSDQANRALSKFFRAWDYFEARRTTFLEERFPILQNRLAANGVSLYGKRKFTRAWTVDNCRWEVVGTPKVEPALVEDISIRWAHLRSACRFSQSAQSFLYGDTFEFFLEKWFGLLLVVQTNRGITTSPSAVSVLNGMRSRILMRNKKVPPGRRQPARVVRRKGVLICGECGLSLINPELHSHTRRRAL